MRIREQGKVVVGIGKRQTARSFIAACNTFIEIETLETAKSVAVEASPGVDASAMFSKPLGSESWTDAQKQQLKLLHDCVVECSESDGWARINIVGGMLKQRDPAFDGRKLGSSSAKLGKMFESLSAYETKQKNSTVWVRVR